MATSAKHIQNSPLMTEHVSPLEETTESYFWMIEEATESLIKIESVVEKSKIHHPQYIFQKILLNREQLCAVIRHDIIPEEFSNDENYWKKKSVWWWFDYTYQINEVMNQNGLEWNKKSPPSAIMEAVKGNIVESRRFMINFLQRNIVKNFINSSSQPLR